MSLVAIGVTVGSPDTAAQVPVNSTNLASNVATALADFDTAMSDNSNGLATLLNASGISYNSTTHQLAQAAGSTSSTVTYAEATALMNFLNTALAALVAAQNALAGMSLLVQTDTTLIDHISDLNAALVAALNFARSTNIMPA